jgi:hypothetical protein
LHELQLSTALSSPVMFADDTTSPVLDPGRGKTKTGRLWCYAVDNRPWRGPGQPAAAYVYSEDRKGEHLAGHLKDFKGLLQTDGYAGFIRVARTDGAVKLAFCWAHARRKFHDIHAATESPIAEEALRRAFRDRGGCPRSDRRTAPVRAPGTVPVEAMHAWMTEQLARVPGRSAIAQVFRYALTHWDGLTVFLKDGRAALDTNVVERAMRPVALGRKNALFAGSDEGATYCASDYVLIIPAHSGVDFQVAAFGSCAVVQRPGGPPAKRGLRGERSMARSGRSDAPRWSRCRSVGGPLSGSASGPRLLRRAWPLRVPPVRLPDRAGFVSGGGAGIRSRATNRSLGR